MTTARQIKLRVGPVQNGLVKVVWTDDLGSQFPPYYIYHNILMKLGENARQALEAMASRYPLPDPDYCDAVAGLAETGLELRNALFEQYPPEYQLSAAAARNWFETLLVDSLVLTIHSDPNLPLPWGLLHDRGPGRDEEETYGGFWATRHSAAVLYNGMKPRILSRPREADRVRLIAAVNEEVFLKTRKQLETGYEKLLEAIVARPVGQAFTTKGLTDRWRQVGDNDCLLYFFGHATGQELQFSDADRLSATRFRTVLRREGAVSGANDNLAYVLTILNGCATVTGTEGESFLVATADEGFCGFIGAEATVPDEFGMLFGQDLLRSLLWDGLSVREAMARLWRKHRPLGLFYGCYAHPEFRVTGAEVALETPDGFDDRNFSYRTLPASPR